MTRWFLWYTCESLKDADRPSLTLSLVIILISRSSSSSSSSGYGSSSGSRVSFPSNFNCIEYRTLEYSSPNTCTLCYYTLGSVLVFFLLFLFAICVTYDYMLVSDVIRRNRICFCGIIYLFFISILDFVLSIVLVHI